jgi:methyltransferase (TIGR00027 family)
MSLFDMIRFIPLTGVARNRTMLFVRASRPSFTAAYVAACRGLASALPEAARLVEDPYGLRFGPRTARALARAARHVPWLVHRLPPPTTMLWLQIRTRVLDDALRDFVRAGGRQVLLLGAGFDCRAARLRDELDGARVFEVDHPATQARKRSVLDQEGAPQDRTAYLPWDFERDIMSEMPTRLHALGHDPGAPTLTIWEGVAMYLTEPAIESTVATVRALSGPGSQFAITYFDRAWIERPPLRARMVRQFVARLGEPFKFGWDPPDLPRWLGERGWKLEWDRTDLELAARLLPEHGHYMRHGGFRHIALATRLPEG